MSQMKSNHMCECTPAVTDPATPEKIGDFYFCWTEENIAAN